MTYDRAIEVILNEMECVKNANTCDRNCGNCNLVLPDIDILQAYNVSIEAIKKLMEENK